MKNYIGKFVEANISFADEYDLYGETTKILKFFYINLTALKSLSNAKAAPKPKPINAK